ncbi:choline-phosphate cytidylyltransferase, putative [Entamoeba invadens IP1]|uniref:ethanolamine-phosphate cytidylyltransferase n=1 Tax=Entamoeba invadens IP1 TaxID=370355 RepID=A0A0A1TWZ0_ENTIV|nr:choline-phosphate cytidylyltransferase, putative [Entamoeba invadens IP1]ELP85757.1 choline-phosphate cytidylyltransferase, putative [Entamoeba invadens IP1]|eukprot:XP_004185103.1 choline-phosphate cytidylyltransferase, putative [Entamoeba invadens IP1]
MISSTLFKHHVVLHVKPKSLPRIYIDGCYDLFHWGHANVFRQACELFNFNCVLVVGICEDSYMKAHNKNPVLTNEERILSVMSCQFVDEIVDGIDTWNLTVDLINELKIDFIFHGVVNSFDISNGKNCYQEIINTGRLKFLERTDCVSTLDFIKRMKNEINKRDLKEVNKHVIDDSLIQTFSLFKKERNENDSVVFIDGCFDMLHVGHYELFRIAKDMGKHLIVGIYDDEIVKQLKGKHFPIMNLKERTLNVLACKYVDEVIQKVPYVVSSQFLDEHNISVVVHGKVLNGVGRECYKQAIEKGIYKEKDSGKTVTSEDLFRRVTQE